MFSTRAWPRSLRVVPNPDLKRVLHAGVASHVPVALCGGVRTVGPVSPVAVFVCGQQRTLRSRVTRFTPHDQTRALRPSIGVYKLGEVSHLSGTPAVLTAAAAPAAVWLFRTGSAGCHSSGISDALNTADRASVVRRATTLKTEIAFSVFLHELRAPRGVRPHPQRNLHQIRIVARAVPGSVLSAQSLHSFVECLCVIGDGVSGRVAGPQFHAEDLTCDIGGAVHRMEPVPLVTRCCSLFVLRVHHMRRRSSSRRRPRSVVTAAAGPRRCDIYWAELREPTGSEPGYRRPVLVVSADSFNRSRISTVVVVAISSNTRLSAAPGNVELLAADSGLPRDSVANVSQVLTLDKNQLASRAAGQPRWSGGLPHDAARRSRGSD